jgi:hypothetical protein
MRAHRILVGFFIAGLLVLSSVSLASATQPEVEGGRDEDTVELHDCGSFQVLDHYVIEWTQTWFVDNTGTRIRFIEQVWGTDTFINSMTGEEYPTRFHNTVRKELTSPFAANSGIIFRLTIPGAGAVFLDVGRIVTNRAGTIITFEAGPHQFFDGEIDVLCDALA